MQSQDKLALGEDGVKHLLPLMEADRHGKVSRQEYMKFSFYPTWADSSALKKTLAPSIESV
jgi:hypothetical protein